MCANVVFQIFFPDLIDKSKTPEYTVVSVSVGFLLFDDDDDDGDIAFRSTCVHSPIYSSKYFCWFCLI